ncbi:prolyl oligopeptidase [Sphingopyxis panaciterrae]|uniref:prolyl oligopeptidase family serine peptidase n=1 Tax=Sphingopyxis panaciterrae TaxID=363841 RepID=UPI0014209CA4|nr:prolyl oligopeptidase family serine peptidase [Sphingopyxis panaciterrae]NIJ35864.1 prolyl oligopeptidase [Sphingopyxis panaciterrae]
MTVTEVIGGVPVRDPFRWLEDDADPKVAEWQNRANAQTVEELAASPHAGAVAAAVRATFEDIMMSTAPERFGNNWFRKILPPGGTGVVLTVSDSPAGKGRVIVDPAGVGANATITGTYPSPDGTLVFAGIVKDGEHSYRIVNVADGMTVRDDFAPFTNMPFAAWMPDNSGFYFMTMAVTQNADGQVIGQNQIWWQPLAGDAEQQNLEFDHPMVIPVVSADGRWAAINASQVAVRPRWIRRVDGGEWIRFLPDATAMYRGIFVGDEYWAITDDVSGWCRLVAIPLDSFADEASWRELVPAREDHKLLSITQCGDYIALSTIEYGVMRLRSLDLTGRDVGNVPLPGDGAFGLFGLGYILALLAPIVAPDGNGCTFVHSRLDQGPAVYRADLATLSIEEIEAPAHVLADRDVRRFDAAGPNGSVSYWLMRKASTPLDGSAPVIAMGYGGFNVPEIPHYTAMAAAWTELGGIWVHTQLRGGGDRDKAFWEAGRMHRKQGTFDDLYAVIEDLHARGFAVPGRTGAWGTSNGGLLVGAAVSQRPDLLGAAVAQVPILDLMQMRKDPATLGIAMADYGNPDDPADAPVMHAYSPYHNVRPGTAYPALLCDAGADDNLCPPWHSRKMVAAVEGASTSGRRVRLRVRHGAGHNQMTSELLIQRDIEELTFLYDELTRPA